jgi:hypothetical protein
MSLTPALFGQLAQAMGIFVLVCALITGLALAFNWSWRYRMVGATLFSTIAVAPTITPEQLESTLKQASSNLFSSGRNGQGESQLTIYARTIVHVREGVSKPLYLGRVKRSLSLRNDPNIELEIFIDKFAELPQDVTS